MKVPKCQNANSNKKIMQHKYSLDKTSKQVDCPNCSKKRLKLYWDNEKNEYFPDSSVGRCNRQDSCGYHLTPKQYFEVNELERNPSESIIITPPPSKPPTTYMDLALVEKTFKRDLPNNFIIFLKRLFEDSESNFLVEKFKISTSNYWDGSTIFWQIDEQMRVRTGKVMLYNIDTRKRVKKPFNHIHWTHSLAKLKDFQLEQCFFGLHQLIEELDNVIGIAESEKTAIMMTAIYPKITWLASGGMGLSISKFEPLEGRKIILFPDAGLGKGGRGTPFEIWSEMADTLSLLGFDINVSNLVENASTEKQREDGYDLADHLIKTDSSGFALAEGGYPLFWDFKIHKQNN